MNHVLSVLLAALAQGGERALPVLSSADVFQLEITGDPQISPDGARVVYERRWMDVMRDRVVSHLWTVQSDGEGHQPLVTGASARAPRWSSDGTRLAYVYASQPSRVNDNHSQ